MTVMVQFRQKIHYQRKYAIITNLNIPILIGNYGRGTL